MLKRQTKDTPLTAATATTEGDAAKVLYHPNPYMMYGAVFEALGHGHKLRIRDTHITTIVP